MTDSNSSGSEPSYNSYADYVASVFGDGYGKHVWLVDFLRQGSENRAWICPKPHIEIHILDSVNNTLESRSFIAPRRGPVDQVFLDVLRNPSRHRRTRLVLLQCGDLGDTNGSYIDAIGLHYMLDPYFFCAHFDLYRDFTKVDTIRQSYMPILLPSERRFLQIITDRMSLMTATWKISGNECTC